MTNTKEALITLGVALLITLWVVAHMEFWLWLLGSATIWSFLATLLTGLILPSLGTAIYLDSLEKRGIQLGEKK